MTPIAVSKIPAYQWKPFEIPAFLLARQSEIAFIGIEMDEEFEYLDIPPGSLLNGRIFVNLNESKGLIIYKIGEGEHYEK